MMPTTAIETVLSRLKKVKRTSSGWNARCPGHDDHENSLSIGEGDDGRVLLNCFAGCAVIDIVTEIDLKMADLFEQKSKGASKRGHNPSKSAATPQPQQSSDGCTLDKYAETKKLPLEFLKQMGLQTVRYSGKPAVRIPYLSSNGQELAIRYRIAMEKSGQGDVRFRWKQGSKLRLYGVWLLDHARKTGYAIGTEGESDCHTLWFYNFPAFGIPGANSWREEWIAELEGIPKIFFIIEPDQGGQAVLKKLATSKIRDRAWLIFNLGAKDPSELHLSDPDGFRETLQQALDSAVPWHKWAAEQIDSEMAKAWEQCKELAEKPQILECFSSDLERSGVAGEKRAGKLIFLILNTRFLPRPVSAAPKGPSSAGKNYLTEHVLDFFPPDAYHALTAMSQRALAYSEEPLSHRFLVIFEAVGLQNDFTSYLVRSLLSEGRIRYETVEKTKDGLKARLIEREGPTGLLVTTTAVSLHPENETRLLSIPISDTPEQTRDILLKQAEKINNPLSDSGVDFGVWHALQQWLQGAEHGVYIPYAEALAKSIPTIAVRLRRDFPAILSLICAHAILHQATRGSDDEGRIVATLDDYAVVRELVVDLVAEAVEATVSPTVKETVDALRDLGAHEIGVTNTEVAKKLGLDKSAAYRRVKTAIHKGYVKNLEDKKGRPACLVLGDPLPDEVEVLPLPKSLASDTGCNNGATTHVAENEDINPDGCRVAEFPEGIGNSSDDSAREVFTI